ncbi:hypothetical protein [Burkholderia gladioli]|uniref:hypothetical protein n=1 Tax=Burkholderia gladioli TaxID=28095 RepID=UPI001FC85031|nr:hypothetical protein [Burkholderia gladioli]
MADMPSVVAPEVLIELEIKKPTIRAGTIEVRIGRAVVKVDGVVDLETLQTVLGLEVVIGLPAATCARSARASTASSPAAPRASPAR